VEQEAHRQLPALVRLLLELVIAEVVAMPAFVEFLALQE
jgi:hypothetical protein